MVSVTFHSSNFSEAEQAELAELVEKLQAEAALSRGDE